MSDQKKRVRGRFRQAVLRRDGYRCRACGIRPENGDAGLDAHHVTDRSLMPGGGYVPENGVTLCRECHQKAEEHHRGNVPPAGFAPGELYELIGSSYEEALAASQRAGG